MTTDKMAGGVDMRLTEREQQLLEGKADRVSVPAFGPNPDVDELVVYLDALCGKHGGLVVPAWLMLGVGLGMVALVTDIVLGLCY